MKKILILGAGIYQFPLIEKAKELGLYTIVISVKGSYPGFEIADKVYYEDTTNYEEIIGIAQKENIDGICTTGTDAAIKTLGAVCETLGLVGITKKSGELATNKLMMKDAFAKEGVCSSKFRKVVTLNDAYEVFEELSKPVIFKSVDTSGSRGIIKISTKEEVENGYNYVFSATKLNYFIIEDFIEGIEFGAQTSVIDGKIQFVMIHGDILFHGKTDIPIGHYVPFDLDDLIKVKVEKQIELSSKALGLSNCAINVDFILKENEIYVLEIGARAGATCLPELVSIYYDFDYYRYLIDISLGGKPKFKKNNNVSCGNLLYVSNKSGKLHDVNINDRNSFDIVEEVSDYLQSKTIRKFEVGTDRIGHVVIRSKPEEEIVKKLSDLQKNMEVVLK